MAVIVFDLDMTIVDSSHRHVSKPDGSIDLAAWFENCHRVSEDTLLPLAAAVKRLYDRGHHIVFCTARCMQMSDWDWIARHSDELPHHILYSRTGYFVQPGDHEYPNSYHGFIGDGRSDEEIKLEQVQEYVETLGFKTFEEANVIIFEDNLKTLAAFEKRGAIPVNANIANKFEARRAA